MDNSSHRNQDLETYFDLIERLQQGTSRQDRIDVARHLVSLLRSRSISVRRNAKYKLREVFSPQKGLPSKWSPWGPPQEAEIVWWEKHLHSTNSAGAVGRNDGVEAPPMNKLDFRIDSTEIGRPEGTEAPYKRADIKPNRMPGLQKSRIPSTDSFDRETMAVNTFHNRFPSEMTAA